VAIVDLVLMLILRLLLLRIVLRPLKELEQYAINRQPQQRIARGPVLGPLRGELEAPARRSKMVVAARAALQRHCRPAEMKIPHARRQHARHPVPDLPEGLVSYVGPQITRYGFTEDDFIGAKVGKVCPPGGPRAALDGGA